METPDVSLEDLRVTAELARITLDDAEVDTALAAFRTMVSYFAAMQEAAAEGLIEGTDFGGNEASFTAGPEHFRADQPPAEQPPSAHGQKLVEHAGESDSNFVVVPNVL